MHLLSTPLTKSIREPLSICVVFKLLLNERSLFTFDFAITHTLCKGSTSYMIRYMSMNSGSVEQQIFQHGLVSHLSLLSTRDQSNLTARFGCRVVKSLFFSPQNWAPFKLLPWVDFPTPWVKGLKYCINYI